MIVKQILNKIEKMLSDKYNVNTYSQGGYRLAVVIYQAYIGEEKEANVGNLFRKAHKLAEDSSSYSAFERSIYREIKEAFPNIKKINILKEVYSMAEEVTI
jgi:hypothetical protein